MEEEIGKVDKYFAHPEVAAITVTGSLKVGDTIHIKGTTTDLTQTVDSMEVKNEKIEEAKAGDDIGIKVNERVRPGDKVYKVTGEEPAAEEVEAEPAAEEPAEVAA
jgi:putative protease